MRVAQRVCFRCCP